ncbi:divergent protein kinase domain 2A-like [Anopheles albimanus]|uniref:PIP49_C domain-containing protein n=1 Tax=Anopheles albimanus TaxID=7167 RepID=A0A182F438_ANOAL|nr:divergent protein kinase domain 2A-like [Anopheles albimanus]XP_035793055.1 divergent protein kinase domain 2A-like [Anopheles albimanus]XP_035793056.1 divergent protein kinase domain 2A-like [Anopheles albimanus]XP_035793057.1 divergent protein kinase domain 2A-like [Anopheles albimanus]
MPSKVSVYYAFLFMIIMLRYQPRESSEGKGPLESTCEYETRQLCPECFYGQSVCRHADQLFEEQHGSWFNKINNLMHAHSTTLGTFRGTERAVMKTLNRHKAVESLQRAFCDMVQRRNSPETSSAVCSWSLTGNSKDSEIFLKKDILDVDRIEGCLFCPASGNRASLHRFLHSIDVDRTTELWKLLAVRSNVELLLLMLASQHNVSMPFPRLLHYFGFSFIECYAGEPLSSFYHSPLHLRMLIARELIKAAFAITEGIEGFRFILTDLSPDNIAVSIGEDHKAITLSIVDLNNVIVIDSLATTFETDRNHVHSKIECDGCFAYSQNDICSHRTSDLNYFAICQLLLEDLNGNAAAGFLHYDQRILRNDSHKNASQVGLLHNFLRECVHCQPPHCRDRSVILVDILNVLNHCLS